MTSELLAKLHKGPSSSSDEWEVEEDVAEYLEPLVTWSHGSRKNGASMSSKYGVGLFKLVGQCLKDASGSGAHATAVRVWLETAGRALDLMGEVEEHMKLQPLDMEKLMYKLCGRLAEHKRPEDALALHVQLRDRLIATRGGETQKTKSKKNKKSKKNVAVDSELSPLPGDEGDFATLAMGTFESACLCYLQQHTIEAMELLHTTVMGSLKEWVDHLCVNDPSSRGTYHDKLFRLLFKGAAVAAQISGVDPLEVLSMRADAIAFFTKSRKYTVDLHVDCLTKAAMGYERTNPSDLSPILDLYNSEGVMDGWTPGAALLLVEHLHAVARKAGDVSRATARTAELVQLAQACGGAPGMALEGVALTYRAATVLAAWLEEGDNTEKEATHVLERVVTCLKEFKAWVKQGKKADATVGIGSYPALLKAAKALDGLKVHASKFAFNAPASARVTAPPSVLDALANALAAYAKVIELGGLVEGKGRLATPRFASIRKAGVDALTWAAFVAHAGDDSVASESTLAFLRSAGATALAMGGLEAVKWTAMSYCQVGVSLHNAGHHNEAEVPLRAACKLLDQALEGEGGTAQREAGLAKVYLAWSAALSATDAPEAAARAAARAIVLSPSPPAHAPIESYVSAWVRAFGAPAGAARPPLILCELLDGAGMTVVEVGGVLEGELWALRAHERRHKCARDAQRRLIARLLRLYAARVHPIRRARVLSEAARCLVLTNDGDNDEDHDDDHDDHDHDHHDDTDSIEEGSSAVDLLSAALNLSKGGVADDNDIACTALNEVATAYSWRAIASSRAARSEEEEAEGEEEGVMVGAAADFRHALRLWSRLLSPTTREGSAGAFFARPEHTYEHLRMLAHLFGYHNEASMQIHALRLAISMGQQVLEGDSCGSSATSYATMAGVFSSLGYLAHSERALGEAKDALDGACEREWHVYHSQLLSETGRLEESAAALEEAVPGAEAEASSRESSEVAAVGRAAFASLRLKQGMADMALDDALAALRRRNTSLGRATLPLPYTANVMASKGFMDSLHQTGTMFAMRGAVLESDYYFEHGLRLARGSAPFAEVRFRLALADLELQKGALDTAAEHLARVEELHCAHAAQSSSDISVRLSVATWCLRKGDLVLAGYSDARDAPSLYEEGVRVCEAELLSPAFVARTTTSAPSSGPGTPRVKALLTSSGVPGTPTTAPATAKTKTKTKMKSRKKSAAVVAAGTGGGEEAASVRVLALLGTLKLSLGRALVADPGGEDEGARVLRDLLEETRWELSPAHAAAAHLALGRLHLARAHRAAEVARRWGGGEGRGEEAPASARGGRGKKARTSKKKTKKESAAMEEEEHLPSALLHLQAALAACLPLGLAPQLQEASSLLALASGPAAAPQLCHLSLGITLRHTARYALSRKARAAAAGGGSGVPSRDSGSGSESEALHLDVREDGTSPPANTPEIRLFELSVLSEEDFSARLALLPAGVAAVSLGVVEVSDEEAVLMVTRLERGAAPVAVHVPLARGDTAGGLDDLLGAFRSIIEESTATTSSATTSATRSKKAKEEWWEARRSLDSRMEAVLRSIEDRWLGPWRALLLGSSPPSSAAAAALASLSSSAHVPLSEARGALLRLSLTSPALSGEAARAIAAFSLGKEPEDEEVSHAVAVAREGLEEGDNRPYRSPPVVLILDRSLQALPWESLPCLRGRPVSRMPALPFLLARGLEKGEEGGAAVGSVADTGNAFFVLNPSGDLTNTQGAFEKTLSAVDGWRGVAGRPPEEDELWNDLPNAELFVYCGHSAGEQFISPKKIQALPSCPVSLLMGCSSGLLRDQGAFDPTGTVLSYILGGSPAVVANLWDVTDKDIDRYTLAVLSSWVPDFPRAEEEETEKHASLLDAVASSRDVCVLPYLVGAAPVCYGLPVFNSPGGTPSQLTAVKQKTKEESTSLQNKTKSSRALKKKSANTSDSTNSERTSKSKGKQVLEEEPAQVVTKKKKKGGKENVSAPTPRVSRRLRNKN